MPSLNPEGRVSLERSIIGRGMEERPMSGVLKGAIAGAAGVLAMDITTWKMYLRERPGAYAREKKAQVGGKWAPEVAAEKLADRFGKSMTREQRHRLGEVIHYAKGILPGMLYGVLCRKYPKLRTARGLLYGLGLFLIMDELLGPVLGIASRPTEYPWQAHARGLVGQLVLGAVTDAALDALALP